MNILIVEDEVLIAKSLKKLLEKKGAQVQIETSGRSAIKNMAETRYDRVICDLMLQDITGFDVIDESKKVYSNEEIASLFVIITAYSSQQILTKASQYGCIILSKPFEDITQAIDIFLKKGRDS